MDNHQAIHAMTRRTFMRRAMQSAAGLAAVGSLSGLLEACAAPATPAPPTPVPVQKVKVQLAWIEDATWAALYASETQGYAKEEGIEQDFLPGGPQVDPIQAVAGGAAPFGFIGGLNQLILARSNGIPVKAFGTLWQSLPFGLISLASNPIKTPKDAIGKKIGLQSGSRSTWALILAANNLTESQMTIVPVGVDPTPLVSGQVDGYWGTATGQLITLKSQGVQAQMMYMADSGVPGYGEMMIAPEKTLQDQEDLLVRWLKAAIKGGQYYIGHTDELAQYVVTRSPSLNLKLDVQQATARQLADVLQSPLTKSKALYWMDQAVATNLVDIMLRAGQIRTKIDANDLMTLTILQKATGLS
jgi:NitT/TauT family transport system substrate-binding protein